MKRSDVKLFNPGLLLGMGFCAILSTGACGGDLKSVSLPVQSFYFQNNSGDTFKYSYSTKFPDTSILNNLDTNPIYPSTRYQIRIPADLLPNFQTSGQPVEIFLFNVDTLQKYPWQTIVSNYLITKRYVLTYDSLTKLNNTVSYP